MNSFWQSRNAGEKRSLMLLALFSLLLALWYGVLQPLNKTILRSQEKLWKKRKTPTFNLCQRLS